LVVYDCVDGVAELLVNLVLLEIGSQEAARVRSGVSAFVSVHTSSGEVEISLPIWVNSDAGVVGLEKPDGRASRRKDVGLIPFRNVPDGESFTIVTVRDEQV
jgi:hypothetical protein